MSNCFGSKSKKPKGDIVLMGNIDVLRSHGMCVYQSWIGICQSSLIEPSRNQVRKVLPDTWTSLQLQREESVSEWSIRIAINLAQVCGNYANHCRLVVLSFQVCIEISMYMICKAASIVVPGLKTPSSSRRCKDTILSQATVVLENSSATHTCWRSSSVLETTKARYAYPEASIIVLQLFF